MGEADVQLGEIITFTNGKTRPSDGDSSGFPVYGANGIIGYTSSHNAEPHTTVIGRVGSYCGVVHYSKDACWVTDNAIIAKARPGNDAHFIYYLLHNLQLHKYRIGSGQPLLTQGILGQIKIRHRTPPEQTAIAAVLGALDDKIAVNERVASVADSLAFSLYRELVETLDTRVEALDSSATVILGGTPDRRNPGYWNGGTINWINSGKANELRILHPSEMITEQALVNSAAKLMPIHSTVVAITGATMGKVSRLEIEASGNQSLVGVWADDARLNDWIYFWIRDHSDDLTKHGTGGAQQHINRSVVAKLPIQYPDPRRLNEWSQSVRPLLSCTSRVLRENDVLADLRDTLLPKLMSGQLRVREAEGIVGGAL